MTQRPQITEGDAQKAVEPFGYMARQEPLGFFLAPVTKNRFGHRHIGDDEMLVRNAGGIITYAHNAQAYLAATALHKAIRKLAMESARMSEPVGPFEAYLRNALDACISAQVARGYKTAPHDAARRAKENLDAALGAYPHWLKEVTTPRSKGLQP